MKNIMIFEIKAKEAKKLKNFDLFSHWTYRTIARDDAHAKEILNEVQKKLDRQVKFLVTEESQFASGNGGVFDNGGFGGPFSG